MKSVNLIPASRRDAKRRRKQRAACATACGAYAVLLVGAIFAAHVVLSTESDGVQSRLAAMDTEVQRLDATAAEARSELNAARATIEANRTVAEQPDWSILLTLLGATTGEDVVLRSIAIAPPAINGQPLPKGAKAPETVLEVMGVARSQLAVSQHVLRLEQTTLFSKVSLLDTNRESFLNGDAIAFRLQCNFGDSPKHAPAYTAAPTEGVEQ